MSLRFGFLTRVIVLVSYLLSTSVLLSSAQPQAQLERPTREVETQIPPEEKAMPEERGEKRDHPDEREQWFMRGRLYQGKSAAHLLVKAQQQRDKLRQEAFQQRQLRAAPRAMSPQAGPAAPLWTQLGPSPLISTNDNSSNQDYGYTTGRTTAVAVDQGDSTGNTVYIGGAYGGVWKSVNGANPDVTKVVWTPVTDDQSTLAIGAIVIDPSDSNIVLVGTGESNSSTDSYYGLGILRSTDAGNSWTLVTSANGGLRPFHGLAFSRIAFDSDNPSIVVAATTASTEGLTVGAEQPTNSAASCEIATSTATCRGLYYSHDTGQTWSQVTMVDPSGSPDNGSATDVVYNPVEKLFYAWSRAHGLYTSPDGTTFTRAADQGTGSAGVIQPTTTINAVSTVYQSGINCPTSPTNLSTCPIYRGEIALVPGRDEMYVWFVDASSTPVNGGIYLTVNGGKSWTTLNVSGINCGETGCGTEQGDYNLVLTAVPNGSGTDLYAGAINIYRCQINSNNPQCANQPFVNLTHVYGCTPTGSFAHVHPDQHAFDFSKTNPNIIYFGNDGGIYRTIASENGAVVPSTCPGNPPNQPFYPFDNLNGTMGSMTQFVWFQQHPSNQYVLLGGTQDNGSPAVDPASSGTNGSTWHSVLLGDGGYTDINPNNLNEWFTENTNVSIQRCVNGTSCTDSGFFTVINSSRVGADSAAFYMPFMLDPQNSSAMILGTCRVWRMPSNGNPGNALSQTFDGSTTCPSGSPSFVSALAAGGPKNAYGSAVVYAGTSDGQIYVTTNATNTTTTWLDATNSPGYVNASAYPVSSVAIDPTVAAGTTAYATVMGFKTGHVFTTQNAGSTWTDVTGNLPDAPADAVVVDGVTGTIYVATDVGVFVTSAAALTGSSTQWAEVGPATGSGTLPNVAVTRLAVYSPPTQQRRLRVSTYGRGIWEMLLPGVALASGSPSPLNFGSQILYGYTPASTLTLKNNGSATLSINAITVQGTGLFQSNNCPATLVPGYSCKIGVMPTQATAVSGTLIVSTNDPGSPLQIPISGTGTIVSANVGRPPRPIRSTGNQTVVASGTSTTSKPNSNPPQISAAVSPDFQFSFGSSNTTAKAGDAIAPIGVNVTWIGGLTAPISWTWGGCPTLATCQVSPNPTGMGQAATLTIKTTAPSVSKLKTNYTWLALWLPLTFGVAGIGWGRTRHKAAQFVAGLLLLIVTACGGGGFKGATSAPVIHAGTPAGTYTIMVTGTAGTTVHSQNFTLTVQ